MLTFSRRTLFINDPFSLVGKDVGQPICVKSEEGVKFRKNAMHQQLNSSIKLCYTTISLLHGRKE